MKELIKLDFSIVNDKQIHISGCSTSFCYQLLKEEIDIPLLLEKRKEIIKKAKSLGLKISYKNKTKTVLQELALDYQSEYIDYLFLFNTLSKKWKNKLNKGIFVGYSEDLEMDNLFSLSNKIDKKFLKPSSLNVVHNIYNKINDYDKYTYQYSTIYL